jgi:hypothetical protein
MTSLFPVLYCFKTFRFVFTVAAFSVLLLPLVLVAAGWLIGF